jgi:hypothetical protein
MSDRLRQKSWSASRAPEFLLAIERTRLAAARLHRLVRLSGAPERAA